MSDSNNTPTPASAFVPLGDGRFRATTLTRGPWHPDHQHGGPPTALVVREIERTAAALGMSHVARVTANLLRPVPIAELTVEVSEEYTGRNVAHLSARLCAGERELARFTAVAQREVSLDLPGKIPGHPLPQAPRTLEASVPEAFPFNRFATDVSYSNLIDSRTADGTIFRGPSAVWFRMRYPLVAGEAASPLQCVAVAADSGNGISAVLDLRRYAFLNSDLTINLLRNPVGEWICLDARTLLGTQGTGLAESRIFDANGLVGRSTQSLLVRAHD